MLYFLHDLKQFTFPYGFGINIVVYTKIRDNISLKVRESMVITQICLLDYLDMKHLLSDYQKDWDSNRNTNLHLTTYSHS